jgi:probable rRNA maturation factor
MRCLNHSMKDVGKVDNFHEEHSKSAAPLKISVRDLQRTVRVDAMDLEKFAAKAARMCLQLNKNEATDLTKLRELFVLLVSDRRMASLHRRFLNRPGPTDVLTFEHGEIFISVETAQRNARAFGNSLARELQLYIVHGLLHLHGFDDGTEGDARKMEKAQQEVLGNLP